MESRQIVQEDDWNTALARERPRLVRLCVQLTGASQAGEDLAQETLYEAWRSRHKLEAPAGLAPWLSAIARNVCLRWLRSSGREAARSRCDDVAAVAPPAGCDPADEFDPDLELERCELAQLLDRAMTSLPRDTQQALIKRYVDELPRSEIAVRLGLSEAAVAMRLQRGKAALRRALRGELGSSAAPADVVRLADGVWEDTSIWCPVCARRRLQGRFAHNRRGLSLRCLGCPSYPELDQFRMWDSDVLAGVKTYRPALNRVTSWADAFYRAGLARGAVPCPFCGRDHDLRMGVHAAVRQVAGDQHGVHVACDVSKQWGSISLSTLILCSAEGRQFWRDHRRIQSLPEREVETEGRAGLVTSFLSVGDHGRLDVVSARDSYEVLAVYTSPPSMRPFQMGEA